MRRRRHLRALGIVALAFALVGLAGPARAAVEVSPIPQSSWTVNGRVYAVEIVGDVAFVGGQFTSAISPTGQSVARKNLAAFRVSDGSLVSTWRSDAGAVVRALVSDGASLWVGGYFRSIGGVARDRIAKVSTATGAVDRAFAVTLNDAVRALDVAGADLYVGGHFSTVNGTARPYLTKVNAATGIVDTLFSAITDGRVWGLRVNPAMPRLYVAGDFSAVNGASHPGLASVNAASGALEGPTLRSTRPNLAVDVSSDGSMVFSGAGSNAVTGWRASDGRQRWRHYGEGDIQAVRFYNDTLYFGFHDGFDEDFTVKLLAADASTGAFDEAFRPLMTQFWGVYALDASTAGLVVGGDFTRISGVPARGWARFQ